MKLKKDENSQKLRGGYYTPKNIAVFLTDWALDGDNKTIMEPSCGDGRFLEVIEKCSFKSQEILAIEYSREEYLKACNFKKKPFNIVNSDFFTYFNSNNLINQFDVVLGNPPYIRYQYFEEKQREEVKKIYNKLGMKFNKLTNIWVPFLVASVLSLKDNGKIGMVIPAELLQVKYAEQLRLFLSENLNKITIITFEELIFPGVEQEVILFLGEKNHNNKENVINILPMNNDSELINFNSIDKNNYKFIDSTKEKWTKYFLSKEDLDFLRKNISKFEKLSNFCEIDVGIVTGANKYFVVNKNIVKQYQLQDITLPLVGRTTHIPSFILKNEDWNNNVMKNKPSYLLDFSKIPNWDYNIGVMNYIKRGHNFKIHKGYKTSIRKEWYKIPSIWKSDGFFLRRIHKHPKIVENKVGAYTTDTMHRVKMKEGYNINSLAFSFLNSFTFIYSELEGRSYGGGVLELPPNEAEEIFVHYFEVSPDLLLKADDIYRKTKNIEDVLEFTDKEILKKRLGFNDSEIDRFRKVWNKLRNRRLKRSKSRKKSK